MQSSSPAIRRVAHRLTLEMSPVLESANAHREEQIEALKKGKFAQQEIPPEEKVDLLKEAVSAIKRIGVSVPQRRCRCPNPPVERDYITQGSEGWASAAGFFRKHPDYPVAEINRILVNSAKAPPPPQEGRDPFRYTRLARNLGNLFRHIRDIEEENAN